MISLGKASKAIDDAWEVGLDGVEWFARLGGYAVAEACNGCGPEWMSQAWRDKLTALLDLFFPAFCIHDCRFVFDNNGTRTKFDAANDELQRNCLLLADAQYSWFNPMRYIWRHRARLVGEMCRSFGWSAWRDAYGAAQKEDEK